MKARKSYRLDRIAWTTILYSIASMAIFVLPTSAVEFAGGTGEPNDPYQIATAEQLVSIGSDTTLLDKHFVLVNDIDLDPNLPGGKVFSQSPIAPEIRSTHGRFFGHFEGVFDGGGHVIRNLMIRTEKATAGLFGSVRSPAQIRNLGLEGIDIQRSAAAKPVFVGGGLAGWNEGGTILACYAVGGVAEDRQADAPAWESGSNAYDRVGGLVGENSGLVHACYAIVDVRGSGILGGLLGRNEGAVQFSYSAGAVEGTGKLGGLVASSDHGTTRYCYWDTQSSGLGDSTGGQGRISAEMMSRQTYAPWAYTGMWTLDDANDYPRLRWQQTAGTPVSGVPPAYDGGRGEPDDPYQIRTAEQFMALGYRPEDLAKSFVLTADIDFNDVDANEVVPIGGPYLAFSGQFDGQGHILSNLTIARPRETAVAVFGVVGDPDVFPRHTEFTYSVGDDMYSWGWGARESGSTYNAGLSPADCAIRNLHVRDVAISGRQFVGGLVGFGDVTVTDCSVVGQITGLSMVGGLAGYWRRGGIFGCRVEVQVGGEFAIGGLLGYTSGDKGPTLLDCRAEGSVTGLLCAGGLIGFSTGDTLSRCAAECDVYGRYLTGGFVGNATYSTVTMSHATGTVAARAWVGGFVGWAPDATISDSYYRGDVTGEQVMGGFGGFCGRPNIARCYIAASLTPSDPAIASPHIAAFIGRTSGTGHYVDEYVTGLSGCFWDGDLCGLTNAVGDRPAEPASVAGLPTAQMQTAAPFRGADWDLDTIWMICEGNDYPRLRWEQRSCE